MENNVHKTALPIVAGILSIISGAGKLLGVLAIFIVALFLPMDSRFTGRIEHPLLFLVIIGIFLVILGVLAIVGGVFCIKRKNFGLSLTGSIAALLPFNLLGLVSVILVSLSKNEFGI